MIDLVCLVADKNMEAAITAILNRSGSFRVRSFVFEVVVHPHRDPGCFFQSFEILAGYRGSARNALVVLDLKWPGSPAASGEALSEMLEASLQQKNLFPWARVLVIAPELEAWVFSDSPHVGEALGWDSPQLRSALAEARLWPEGLAKPPDPKTAVEWALKSKRKPRSSAIYRDLASRVSLQRCEDSSFLRLRQILREMFPPKA